MVLRFVKLLLALIYHWFVRPALRHLSGSRSPFCMILCYHSLDKKERRQFARQMDYIARETKPVPICYYPQERGVRHVMITFDDAFESVIDLGGPELQKRNIPFAVFIPSGCMGSRPRWLNGSNYQDEMETVATMERLLCLPESLVTLGSHTVTHPHLPQLEKTAIWTEIKGSKDRLESLSGAAIDYLAFPYGEYDESIIDTCKQAGYKHVFTLEFETPYLPSTRFSKGRISVYPSDWMIEFKLKVEGSYAWMACVSKAKSEVKRRLSIG